MNSTSFARAGLRAVVALMVLSAFSAVRATPITWELQDFTFGDQAVPFGDGSTLLGQITYDAVAGTYTNSQVYSIGGPTFPSVSFPFWWDSKNPFDPSNIALVSGSPGSDLTGSIALLISLESPLGTEGLTAIPALQAFEAICADATCTGVGQFQFILNTGQLVASTPVPEPPMLFTLAVGLIAVAGWQAFRRRRAAASARSL